MNLTIVKYNAGNIQSVLYALERIGVQAIVTDDIEQIQKAGKVIFPGVGEASTAMNYLKERKLDEVIKNLRQPVLGVCLGMQLMCAYSEENNTECLGVFDVMVRKFQNARHNESSSYKIPQMGWNTITGLSSPLFNGIKENSFVYYVHSYYAELSSKTIAKTDYIIPYTAAIMQDNFYGVQFHSEKSADTGSQIISNFLNIT